MTLLHTLIALYLSLIVTKLYITLPEIWYVTGSVIFRNYKKFNLKSKEGFIALRISHSCILAAMGLGTLTVYLLPIMRQEGRGFFKTKGRRELNNMLSFGTNPHV